MCTFYQDQLRILSEKLKSDVATVGKESSRVFLEIWGVIEEKIFNDDFDFIAVRNPACIYDLSFREGIVDIGRCYLPDDGRLPNEPNTAEQWLMIGAEWGSFMGQILLLKMGIDSGKTAYDPRWIQAFRHWQNADSDHDPIWKNQLRRFNDLPMVVFELGLRASISLHDAVLAKEVLDAMQKAEYTNITLAGIQWRAERLLQQKQKPSEIEKVIVQSITTGNNTKENQALYRFRPLLCPLPLHVWPGIQTWSDGLTNEYPWMAHVIDGLNKEWALHRVTGHRALKFRPILLVGKPGLGKSRFVQKLGEVLGLPTAFIMMAGMNDNVILKGTSRGWDSARVGYLIEFMLENRTANPLVCLDEIEKVGTGTHNGRIWETLLTMLEPNTAAHITDEYLLGQVDYSAVNWVATANDVTALPEPLRSRFNIVHIGPPSGQDFDHIYVNILRDIARDLDADYHTLPSLHPSVVEKLRQQFQHNAGSLRKMNEIVRSLLQLEATSQLDVNVRRVLQ